MTRCDEFVSLTIHEVSSEHEVVGKLQGLADSTTKTAEGKSAAF